MQSERCLNQLPHMVDAVLNVLEAQPDTGVLPELCVSSNGPFHALLLLVLLISVLSMLLVVSFL